MSTNLELTERSLRDVIAQARKAVADERWVRWAINEAQDGNEAALVYAYLAIVALADREASNQESKP